MGRWHINCDDCGMYADASGIGGVDAIEKIAAMHTRQGHIVSLWEHGNRDETIKVRPGAGIGGDDEPR